MNVVKKVDQNIWNDETGQWEQIYSSTLSEIVKTKDGGNVQDKLDELENRIIDAKTELLAGVDEKGNTLAKLYDSITSLQEIVDSDDIDLDTIQEIVSYVKDNRDDLTLIGTNKINYSDIENNLDVVNTIEGKALDARQGKVLRDLIHNVESSINNIQTEVDGFLTEEEFDDRIDSLSKSLQPSISDIPPENPTNKQIWLKPISSIIV